MAVFWKACINEWLPLKYLSSLTLNAMRSGSMQEVVLILCAGRQLRDLGLARPLSRALYSCDTHFYALHVPSVHVSAHSSSGRWVSVCLARLLCLCLCVCLGFIALREPTAAVLLPPDCHDPTTVICSASLLPFLRPRQRQMATPPTCMHSSVMRCEL